MDIYEDIKNRTNGEIYMGIVGPVRSGKSTFIRNFMQLMVIPQIKDEHSRKRAIDELPQASDGVTIMTTEPKFVPKNAVEIFIGNMNMKVRLADCVGYLIDGAAGYEENGVERSVKTPWFSYDIPFSKAAEIGTRKVITDHSTVGIVISCDGSINEIERSAYEPAERQTVEELTQLGKPFVMVLNSKNPEAPETVRLASELESTYNAAVIPVDCRNLDYNDIHLIFEKLLYSFPVKEVCFDIPKWVEAVDEGSELKEKLIGYIRKIFDGISCVNDIKNIGNNTEKSVPEGDDSGEYNEIIKSIDVHSVNMADGTSVISVKLFENLYYDMLSQLFDTDIHNEYEFSCLLRELARTRKSCSRISDAYEQVSRTGYSFVLPDEEDISIDEPKIIKTGSKYGVKLKAEAPSIHMIRSNVTTEIAPIVGSYEQAKDLIEYIGEDGTDGDNIWNVNIFGKPVRQLVDDGMRAKITRINEESKTKLQSTMDKIVNDSNGGMVCIII
jgi:stage IV sporulation protein A